MDFFHLKANHSPFLEDGACLSDHWSRRHSVKIPTYITGDVLRPPYTNHNQHLTRRKDCRTCLVIDTTNVQRRATLKSAFDSIWWNILAMIENPCYWSRIISASESLGALLCLLMPAILRPDMCLLLEKKMS